MSTKDTPKIPEYTRAPVTPPPVSEGVVTDRSEFNEMPHRRAQESAKVALDYANLTLNGVSEFQNTEKLNTSYVNSMRDLASHFFAPKGTEGPLPENRELSNKMWNWLKNNEGNTEKRAMIMRKITTLRSRFVESIRARLLKQPKDTSKLNPLLRELEETGDKGLKRMCSILGQASKLQDSYEVMSSEEILQFENTLSLMELVDTNELVAMLIEDQPYVTKLATMVAAGGRRVFDDSFAEHGNSTRPDTVDKESDTLMSQFYALQYTDASRTKPVNTLELKRDTIIDPESKAPVPDKGEMLNHNHYVDLARLIAGNERGTTDTNEREPKSENRVAVEAALWSETVRYMTPIQKQYLAYAIKDEFNDEMVKKFIVGGVRAGVLNNSDLEVMAKVHGLSWITQPSMKATVESAVSWREDMNKNITAVAHQLENHYMQNSFLERGVGGLVGMGFSIIGAVTGMVNIIMPFSDAYNDHDNDTWPKKIKDGFKRVLTNGMFGLGVAEMAFGRHLITPITFNEFYSMDSAQRATIENASLRKAFDAAIMDHPKLVGHLESKWNEYAAIAFRNKNNTNPKQGNASRGEYRLYEGDIEMTEDEAKGLGYTSAKLALADITGVFQIATEIHKIDSKEKFSGYVTNNVMNQYAQPLAGFTGRAGFVANSETERSVEDRENAHSPN